MALSVLAIAFTASVSALLPALALIILRIKKKTGLIAAFTGVLGFFVFVLVLESLLHMLVIPNIMQTPWLYVLYGCLASGIFEETSRFIGFKLLSKFGKASSADALAYGIGHGGFEALMLVGIPFIGVISTFFVKNGDLLLQGASPLNYFIPGFERVLAIVLQICLTMLVWNAATKSKCIWVYFASIALHAFANLGSAAAQTGAVTSLVVIYSSLAAAIVLAVILLVYLNKKHKRATVPAMP